MNHEVMLIDLSAVAVPIWMMSQSEPDPNAASQKIVARVRQLASQHPSAAVCCDSGRSFRHELDPQYKANRPESQAPMHHQIALAREQLITDGFPVWAVPGFEADDVIAAAVARATALELPVLIVSSDKDLLALVGPTVRAMSARDGSVLDADGVKAKFGVRPDQVRDYLCLVGDSSDNVKGAEGIGPKKAAAVLALFDTLDAAYAAIAKGGGKPIGLSTSIEMALRAFQPRLATTRALISLRTDVDLPFEQIAAERVPKDAETFAGFNLDEEEEQIQQPTDEPETHAGQSALLGVDSAKEEATVNRGLPGNGVSASQAPSASRLNGNDHSALAVREPEVLAPAPKEWEMQLEPRSMKDARALAVDMHQSRLFSAYGTPAAILSTVMAGRELGMQAMASLRAFHIIEGKPTLAADLIRALVIRSGKAKYFRCTERTATRATFETQRGDDPPFSLTYTIEEGRLAFAGKPEGWDKSGWGRNAADMCVARASTKLARLVYADVIHGLYSPEEFD